MWIQGGCGMGISQQVILGGLRFQVLTKYLKFFLV